MNINKLKSVLTEAGINVETLAKDMGIDRSTLYRKIADPKRMTIKDALTIKNVLHLSNNTARDIFFG